MLRPCCRGRERKSAGVFDVQTRNAAVREFDSPMRSSFNLLYITECGTQCPVMIQWNIEELHTKMLVLFLYITTLYSAQCTIYLLQSKES